MLKFLFSALGITAMAIGTMMFVLGAETTGQAFAALLRIVVPDAPRLTGLTGPDLDSELRFYAVLWVAYGATAFWVAQALPERIKLLSLMLGIFWLGGIGRVISYFAVGVPHPLFVVLMWIEITAAPALFALSFKRGTVAVKPSPQRP